MRVPRLSDIDLLTRLVAYDTTSSNSNLALVDFVCDYLDDTLARIHRLPSEDGSKANLVVALGPLPDDGAGLTLCGHTDVVPAVEPDWQSDPFEAVRRDDTIAGRGTADMKGFLTLAVQTVAEADPETLTCAVYVPAPSDRRIVISIGAAAVSTPVRRRAYPITDAMMVCRPRGTIIVKRPSASVGAACGWPST